MAKATTTEIAPTATPKTEAKSTKVTTAKASAKEVVVKPAVKKAKKDAKKTATKVSAKSQQDKREKAKAKTRKAKTDKQVAMIVDFKSPFEKTIADSYVKLLNECLERDIDEIAVSTNHAVALCMGLMKDGKPTTTAHLAVRCNEAFLPSVADKMRISKISDPSRKSTDGAFIDKGHGLRNKVWEGQHDKSKHFGIFNGVGTRNSGVHSSKGETQGRVRLDSIEMKPEVRKYFATADGKKLVAGLQKKYFKKGKF